MGPEAGRGIGPFDRDHDTREYVGTGFTPDILAVQKELMGIDHVEQPEPQLDVEGAIDEQ